MYNLTSVQDAAAMVAKTLPILALRAYTIGFPWFAQFATAAAIARTSPFMVHHGLPRFGTNVIG